MKAWRGRVQSPDLEGGFSEVRSTSASPYSQQYKQSERAGTVPQIVETGRRRVHSPDLGGGASEVRSTSASPYSQQYKHSERARPGPLIGEVG